MAVPSYATDLVDITTSFTTNWNLVSEGGGGQNALTAPETDDYIQGTESVSRNPFSSSIRGMAYDRAAITVATDDAIFHWWKADVAAALDTFAGGGVHCIHGASITAYKKYYVAGSDDYQKGGWRCSPIDPTATSSLDRGTPGLPDYNTFGTCFDIPASGPSKGFPFKVDMIRHGRQIEVTEGEVANPASWSTTATFADATARRWGIIQETDTGASLQGIIIWGTANLSVYSRDSNKAITLLDTLGFTTTDFTQILFSNTSNDIEWDNLSVKALGTANRGIINVTANGSITWTNSVFEGIDTTTLLSSSTFDGSKWLSTNAVDGGGASMVNGKILTPTIAANTSSLVWNVNTNPDGKLDGMEFSKGTNAHHAIEFGTAIADGASFTLRGCDFGTDFSATEGGTTGDETFHFLDTTGSITLNLVSCTGNFGYRTEGVAVTIVADPITTTVSVTDNTGSPLLGARVRLEASNGTGGLPYLETPTSITRSGTTATATLTAHGIPDGKKAVIRGATDTLYNGVFTITSTGANTFTYTMNGTPAASPATGTITVSGVIIEGLTDSSGQISDSRTIASNQPVSGIIRKGTSSPIFKDSPLSGTISNTLGLSLSSQLILDE